MKNRKKCQVKFTKCIVFYVDWMVYLHGWNGVIFLGISAKRAYDPHMGRQYDTEADQKLQRI